MLNASAGRDVGETLDRVSFGFYHIVIIVILALVGYLEAYATAATGALVVLAKHPLDLSNSDITWLVLGPNVMLCIAMLASSSISDRISRKLILQIGVILSTFFTLVLLFVSSADALIVIRVLAGIGFGMALPAAYPIGSEIMPSKHRKTFGAIYEILLALGFSSVSLFGYLGVHSTLGWKMLAIPGGVLLFVLPILIHYIVPESPRWLISHGKLQAATDEVNKIIRRCGSQVAALSVEEIRSVSAKPAGVPGFRTLFEKKQAQKTFVSISIWACALVSFYLFSTLLPKALIAQGDTVQMSLGVGGILFMSSIPGKIVDGYLMETIGRRLTIMITLLLAICGLFIMAVAHLAGDLYSGTLFLVGTVIVGFTVISSFPAVRIYMTEQFTTELRGRGYFLSEGVGRAIAGIIIPYLIIDHLNSPVIFFGTIILFTFAGALIPMLFGSETIGLLENVAGNS